MLNVETRISDYGPSSGTKFDVETCAENGKYLFFNKLKNGLCAKEYILCAL